MVSESNRGSSANQAQQSKRQRTSLNNDFSGNTAIQDQQLQSNDSSAIQSENYADNQSNVADSNNDDGIDNTFADGSNSFTAEQKLFKNDTRKADLFIDAQYVRWIKLHYPGKSIPTDGGLTCDLFLDIVPASPITFLNLHLSLPRQVVFNQWSLCAEVEQLPSFMDMGILTVPSDRVAATITQSDNAENTIVTYPHQMQEW